MCVFCFSNHKFHVKLFLLLLQLVISKLEQEKKNMFFSLL